MNHVHADQNKPLNAAQQLRRLLRVPGQRAVGRPRQARLRVEPIEPRFMLSGEGLVLPPPPPLEDALHAPIQSPQQALAAQFPTLTSFGTTLTGSDAAATIRELVFVDPSVKDYDALVASALKMREGQQTPADVEVVVLDGTRNGIEQITTWLAQYDDIDAVHIISHGDEASLRLGSATLSGDALGDHADLLERWSDALSGDADILIYGCDIAAGAEGEAFVERLAALTGADVAASINATGSLARGGDWLLERSTGAIESTALFAVGTDYAYLLAAVEPVKSGNVNSAITTGAAAFQAATNLGAQLDAFSEMGYIMPMIDLPFTGLIKTSDGRTLGDILAFKTGDNTTVFDDYMASTGSPTMGGLMDLMGDYLNGRGIYSNLESLVSNAAGSPSIAISATSFTMPITGQNYDTVTVDLTLSREFLQRFNFGGELEALGFDFKPGEGIPLIADININTTYHLGQGQVQLNELNVRVSAKSSVINTDVVLGVLDATASGTLHFDSGTVVFNAIGALTAGDIKTPTTEGFRESTDSRWSIASSSLHAVRADASFDLTGSLGGTSLNTIAGGTPHIDVVFGGLTLNSITTNNASPVITGTATVLSGQKLKVTVGGATYEVTPAGNGTWSLNLGSATPTSGTLVLSSGVANDVTAQIVRTTGNKVLAKATGTLLVNPTVNAVVSSETKLISTPPDVYGLKPPVLSGVARLGAGQTLVVSVAGASYNVMPAANGVWSLDLNAVSPTSGTLSLADQQAYTITASVKQGASTVVQHSNTLTINIAGGVTATTAPSYTSSVTGSDTATVTWSAIDPAPMTVTTTNISNLQAFSALDSIEVARMLQDLGNYLEMLRDSGKFDALLPFTDLRLADALDFTKTINQVIDTQLINTIFSGIAASKTVGPVLTQNVAFDLQFQRAGDERISVVTITVNASETSTFTHIDQLAELLGKKVAAAVNGSLAWTGNNFAVSESLKGGLTVSGSFKTNEEQTLAVHASAGTYQLKLGAGGTLTGPLSVLASPIEVQNALEAVLGVGNVLVTGRPKLYQISFTGTLADTDVASLVVVEGGNIVKGGLIDVTASDYTRATDGRIAGRINLVQANPGDFSVLRVAPSTGVVVQVLTAGSDTTEAVQRLTIVHGATGGTFVLKGTTSAGVEFTTTALSPTATTTQIANALAAQLTGVTGLSVEDVSADYAADNGTRVFDISFGKKDATNYGGYAKMDVVTTNWGAAPPAQVLLQTQQAPALPVGATAAKNEIQRLSISNANGGSFVFGVTLDSLFYESAAVNYGSGTAAMQTALVNMYKLWNPAVTTADISVTAVAGMTDTWDIEFKGQLAGADLPQMRVNGRLLTSPASGSFQSIDKLGFAAGGQEFQINGVTTFVSLNDMLERFQHAVSGAGISLSPTFDSATRSLLFTVNLSQPAQTIAVPLSVSGAVGELSALSTTASLDLTTEAGFVGTIGFDFSSLNTFALRASGTYAGALAAAATNVTYADWDGAASFDPFTVNLYAPYEKAEFSLAFDGEIYDFSIADTVMDGNTERNNVPGYFQTVFNNTPVLAGGVLARLGFSTVGEVVTASLTTAKQLQFTFAAPVSTVKLALAAVPQWLTNPMNSVFGFSDMTSYPAPKAIKLVTNGQLTADAHFSLRIDQSTAVAFTIPADATNTSAADLVADINAVFNGTSVAGHAYLGTGAGGKGFSNMGQVVQAILRDGQIELVTQSAKVATMQILISGKDPATTELGFTPGQIATSSGVYVFLKDVSLSGNYSAIVNGQSGATPATLASAGAATLGMLDLTFGKLWADYEGSMSFSLRNGIDGVAGERISLNDLYDSAASQMALLGLGSKLTTSSTVSATGTPYQSNGQLLRDVGLSVTVGNTVFDVVVTRAATASNTTLADLATDVDAAIHAAILEKLQGFDPLATDPYVGHTFASIVNTGSVGTPKYVLQFSAPTTTLTLADDAELIYDASTGWLSTDLRLSVTVAGMVNPVDVVVRSTATSNNTGLADLVSDIDNAIKLALASAKNNTTDTAVKTAIDALIAATDLVGQSSGELVLKSGVVSAKDLVFKNLVIDGRLLESDYMTTPVFLNAAGDVGSSPKAELIFSDIGITTPDGILASGLNNATTVSIKVDNMANTLAGVEASTVVTIVPANGLGTLTPFTEINWASLVEDFGQLGDLLGNLGELGAFGELGRALPILGTSVSDVFDFSARFADIDSRLAASGATGLTGLQDVLAEGFGIDPSAIGLGLDSTSGSEALKINVDYRVVIDEMVQLEMIFNDQSLLDLLSEADKLELAALLGAVARLKDVDGSAKMQLHADITFKLAFGVDLSNTANKGKLFLYDHQAAGAAGFAGDTGTYATLNALTVSGSNMNFESTQGIYRLGVNGGTAAVTVANSSGFMLDSDASDGADDGRLYLSAYGAASEATQETIRSSNFDVIFDASAHATLPMTLMVSDQLGQLAMEQIDGFINPLPLGKMEIHFDNLGSTFARMGGATGYTLQPTAEGSNSPTVISSQVVQAALPERPAVGNGSGTTTPEGAPVDNDNEAALANVNLDPYFTSTEGEGYSTTPSEISIGLDELFSPTPQANPSSTGFDISLVLPDIEFWQTALNEVLKAAIGNDCDPEKPINGPLIFLLRDPSIIVNTVDKVLESVQKGLDAFSSVLDLPIIGDQLKEATQFIADLRSNVVDAIKSALASAVDTYGGLDNALRMFMFDMLTTDTDGNYIIDAAEINSNVFLNFLRDYNDDGLITPDDIVVEYMAGFGVPEIDPRLAEYLGVQDGGDIPSVLPGQRTAWVTSGINVAALDENGEPISHDDGTPCYVGEAGQVVLDSSLQTIVDDIADAIDSVEMTAGELLDVFQGLADGEGFFDGLLEMVEFIAEKGSNYNYDSLLKDVFGAGVTANVLTEVAKTFRPSSGALAADAAVLKANLDNGTSFVPKAVLNEFKEAIKVRGSQIAAQLAIGQSSAVQFRMNLGQTYTPSLDLSFDIGVPGLNLSLDGGIGLDLNWDLYLGFGVDLKEGFYVVTNMPGHAGIGQVTEYSTDPAKKGVAVGVVDNIKDGHIANLFLVGKPGQEAAVKELQATVDVYLAPGAGNTPAELNAQLFFLNGTLTDNWDGWIKDNDTGIWGEGTDSLGRLSGTQTANYGRTEEMFDGDTGADGSRTRLQLNFAIDLKDVGLFGISALSNFTTGRLTYTDLRNAKVEDLFKVEWDAKAQVNLHMNLGVSLGGEGYLPSIMGDFHMTWEASNKNKYVQQIEQFFTTGYDKLFKPGNPSIWFSDVYIDVGSFFTRFLNPVVEVIQDVTDPIMPVIDALTTPIPGLSDLMGRDYSAVTLASDMSALFGGVSKVDFIIAMINLLDVIDDLPTDTDGMLLPVAEALIVSGTKDRKINLAALPVEVPDVDVPLPYYEIADIDVEKDGLEFSLNAGVGWTQDTTVLSIFQGNMPPLEFDFDLNADVKVPAPYIDVTPVNFTIPGVLDRDGNVAQFSLNIKAGWTDLRLSDILTGNFAPHFDVTVVMPDIDLTPDLLPKLEVLLPTMKFTIGSKTWTWAGGGKINLEWPDAVQPFVNQSAVKTIDLTAPSFEVTIPSIPAFLPTIQVKWPTVHWVGLGKEFTWEQTGSTDLGWSSLISDAGLLSALVDPSKTVVVEMGDIWLPSIDLTDLLPDIDFDLSLPSLPSLPNIDIGLPDIDLPGQETISLKQGFSDFKNALKKPGSALAFPIIDDPLGSVINLLTGKPADLMTFTPPNLEVKVGFRVSYPIYPPLYVGLGGEIKLSAALTLGFDTYGITKFFDSHNIVDIFDGFYVSDNIVKGVDLPEITLQAKLVAFAELNVFIARGGVEGGIKLLGTLDIYDENKDNKYRASELIAAVSEDPLDVVSMNLRGSAFIAAYLELFALFDYVRVWEYTFMDVTLFEWVHDPAAKKPVLGTMSGSTLTLNMGSGIGSIDGYASVDNTAADRKRRSTVDGDEQFTLTGSGGTVNISALLPNGQTYSKTYVGISDVKAYTGAGNDLVDASALDRSVLFIAGGGNDTLIGGSADDVLIGSDTGNATLIGNGGNDVLIARGGNTSMSGGNGNDTYRFLGDWGQATITDTVGSNVIDYSRQTQGVTIDDAYFKGMRGSNLAQWAANTTIDLVKGGTGNDIIDFSGNAGNLLVTVNGTNKGWVRDSASGMTQTEFDSTTASAMKTAGDNAGRGFKFEGVENVVGGQGSDVFRIRDGASLTGSLRGDTEGGLHHDATSGNELANARNTIDFSEYTRSVQVNEEGYSAFGTAAATNIVVRGFHNIFGGSAGDILSGDGRNNLIVGNDGTDILEGKAAHDLLVADTFVTYTNLLAGQTRPADSSLKNVADYLSLQAVGAAEFGAASRNWIWKGQTLENRSLSITGSQTLKGGTGNDVIMGALGGDVINIGGTGEGNDTIMADLGKVQVDFLYRSALSATTFGSQGGGNDTIYLGSGSNLVLAGNGKDRVIGADAAGSTNIVLGDNGTVQFKTVEASFAGQTKLTFDVEAGRTHLLDYVVAPVAENGGSGNDDSILLGSGNAVVLGGAGSDTISFNAATSTGKNSRFVSGDHARIDTDANGGVVSFSSLDLAAASGGSDTISIGSPNDAIERHLGRNYVIAGMGDDKVLVSAAVDAETGVITHGQASSEDVILSDNGTITRWDSIAASSTWNYLKQVESTVIDQGGNDEIVAANGDKVIITGFGSDSVIIETVSNSQRMVMGDNGRIEFDTLAGMVLMTSTDTQAATGGDDFIRIGKSTGSADIGTNFVIGGMGADRVLIAGGSFDPLTGEPLAGAGSSEDVIIGDNGEIRRDALTNKMLQVKTLLSDKGDNDIIVAGNGGKVIAGGAGADVVMLANGTHLVIGDSGEFNYDTIARNGILRDMLNVDLALGGDDKVTTGEGYKVILGGFGADRIDVIAQTVAVAFGLHTVTGIPSALAAGAVEKRGRTGRYVAGDNARVTFDTLGGLSDLVSTDGISATGGGDTITLGKRDVTGADLGYQVVIGGVGADNITVRSDYRSEDLIFGDNGELHRQALGYNPLSLFSTNPNLGDNDAISTGRGNKIVLGGMGSDTIKLATVKEAGQDERAIVLGDSGSLTWDASGAGSLQRIESTGINFGGDDNVTVGDGDVTFIGGFGNDGIAVTPTVLTDDASSTTAAFRVLVGDNALLNYAPTNVVANQAGNLISLVTLDQTAPTGGNDNLRIGPLGNAQGDIGQAIIVGGVGADSAKIFGRTAKTIMVGDNVSINRLAGASNDLVSIRSLLPDLGAADTLETVSGHHILIGGTGGDTLRGGRGEAVVFGDAGSLDYDPSSTLQTDFGYLRSASSLGIAQGGNDIVELGAGAGNEPDGRKVVVGGFGADVISIQSLRGDGVTAMERIVSGDNANLGFDVNGRLLALATVDGDLSTGGRDQITLIMAGEKLAGDPLTDFNVVAGGVGDDAISVLGATRSIDVLAGDNLDYRRTSPDAGNPFGQHLSAGVLLPGVGGNDSIRTGSGDKIIFGGAANDTVDTQTVAGDRNIVFGDTGQVVFDPAGSGKLMQMTTTNETQGGVDRLVLGAGQAFLFGGLGSDTLTINGGDNVDRIVAGDNAQVNFGTDPLDGATYGKPVLVQTTTGDGVDATQASDAFVLPNLGTNYVLGGAGLDTLTGSVGSQHAVIPGSGAVSVDSDPLNRVISVVMLGEWQEMGIEDLRLVKGPGGGTDLPPGASTGVGRVTEDTTLTAGGWLSVPALTGGLATFPAGTYNGNFGNLTVAADGTWVYTLGYRDGAADATVEAKVQALKDGDLRTEVFLLSTTDGTPTSVTITVHGKDDTPVATNDAIALNEDDTLAVSGNVLAGDTDADQGQTAALVVTSAQAAGALAALAVDNAGVAISGLWGSLLQRADGSYSYQIDPTRVQHLAAGVVVSDSFTLTIADPDGNTTTSTFAVSITGANDAPVLAVDGNAVIEDAQTTANGNVLDNASDVDDDTVLVVDGGMTGTAGSLQALVAGSLQLTGSYGVLTLNDDGSYAYALDNVAAQALTAGESHNDVFTVSVSDGAGGVASATLTISVTGQGDAAQVGGSDAGDVDEDASLPIGGTLTISDADAGEALFVAGNAAGAYGEFVIGSDGVWQYTLDSSLPAVQGLDASGTLSEVFTVTTADGTTHQVTVTVRGANDPASVGGDLAASLDEDDSSVTGSLSISDGDGDASFIVQDEAPGDYGNFSIDADGNWTYVRTADLSYLGSSDSLTDSFLVEAADGTTQTVVVTLLGRNTPAEFSGDVSATLGEGGVSTGGSLTLSDPDSSTSFVAQSGDSTYGEFSLDVDGNWTYTRTADLSYLRSGESVTDSFTVSAPDGTTLAIEITLTGTDNVAVIGGSRSGSVAVDGDRNTSGQLSIVDPDSGEAGFMPTTLTGTYGVLTVAADGAWTYTLANNSAVNALRDSEVEIDQFIVLSVDGTATTITLSVQAPPAVPPTGVDAGNDENGLPNDPDLAAAALFFAQPPGSLGGIGGLGGAGTGTPGGSGGTGATGGGVGSQPGSGSGESGGLFGPAPGAFNGQPGSNGGNAGSGESSEEEGAPSDYFGMDTGDQFGGSQMGTPNLPAGGIFQPGQMLTPSLMTMPNVIQQLGSDRDSDKDKRESDEVPAEESSEGSSSSPLAAAEVITLAQAKRQESAAEAGGLSVGELGFASLASVALTGNNRILWDKLPGKNSQPATPADKGRARAIARRA